MKQALVGRVENKVLYGLDDYLFLFSGGQSQFAYLTGEMEPSQQSVFNFFDNIRKRKSFCDSRGIPYFHVVFPSKPVVMQEKVPEPWRGKLQSLFLSQYAASLGGAVLPDHIVYPKNTLLENKKENRVFRLLDTHMTDFGCFCIAQDVLGKVGIGCDLRSCFRVDMENHPGDLADMLGLSDRFPEACMKPLAQQSLFYDNIRFLPGNTNNVRLDFNAQAVSKKRLLIFGDSFMKQTLKFFSAAFREVLYIRSSVFQYDIVEMYAPDVIISSNAERYLSKVDSDEDSDGIIFAHYGDDQYKPSEAFVSAYKAQLSYRYHRAIYDAWRKKIDDEFFSIEGVGACVVNDHVEILSKDTLSFASKGNDPILKFTALRIVAEKRYVLEVDMTSSVSSVAVVYYSEEVSGSTSELRIAKACVTPGKNKLRFDLNSPKVGLPIRFDPLACLGEFKLDKLSFIEAP